MPRCIYSQVEFAEAHGEHILQNFLGARWTSRTIVCNELQAAFGETIDAALEEGLRPIRNLFGTRGGRGESGPVLRNLSASTGELLDFEPGLKPRLRKPIVRATELSDGSRRVAIQLGVLDQLGWALSMLRGQVPNLSVDESSLQALARSVEGYIQGTVKLELCIGGMDYFRGMLKASMNLLGERFPQVVQQPCFDLVRDFIRHGEGDSGSFIRWVSDAQPLNVPRLGPIDQAIFITSRGAAVEGVVQFFGDIVHPFRLSANYDGEPIHCGYVVDPLRECDPAEERNPEFAPESVPDYSGQLPENSPPVQAAFTQRLTRILRVFYDRAHDHIVGKTLDEVLRPHMGEPFTEELAGLLAQKLAERLARRGGPIGDDGDGQPPS
ncbi:MAG: hypothetical protein BIFFINMI_02472 [Phycisphaerae bacterium]|nr:hypothetical protein [Phycisphaerae bacterium]